MKIIEIKNIEDCFDGSFIKELFLDEQITKEYILLLKEKGELKYYPTFARPFFSFEIEDVMNIKGVEGNYSIRIWMKNEKAIEIFQNL
ncbi:MAG TPA: hypothetical protein DDX39_10800 [Bacteroidales bacterium]|nr:MAG: hypothetical protein A2W98_13190 [Bacteroidetes bacterium GWF2_33_38]OFY72972.1 MAG: hypothetical protein A2265_06670 [Bacteroidetes bacterium RIFOXYA12_FULL_33_9]HBF89120.1 hypothetical protein [Bacteroidales bacterium]